MCFSATASFTSGAVLVTAGLITLSQIKSRKQVLFAVIPLIFGLQQISEGFLWLSIDHQEYYRWNRTATHIFAVFGQIVWPVWVPLSLIQMEGQDKKLKILKFMLLVGILLAIYLAYNIISQDVTANAIGGHIDYMFDFPLKYTMIIASIIYVLPTVMSHFLSSHKQVRTLGYLVVVSLSVTVFFYSQYIFSVWCFFAAIISVSIFFIIRSLNKEMEIEVIK
ncbi:MAG: hypothetical protein H7321_08310 [Bacteroidia bacterium]|nr:hypothetical protein [Bacteroidia bacterium]